MYPQRGHRGGDGFAIKIRHTDIFRGLGWTLKRSSTWNLFGNFVSEETFGQVGFHGTVAWLDPQSALVGVVLTSRPWLQGNGLLLQKIFQEV